MQQETSSPPGRGGPRRVGPFHHLREGQNGGISSADCPGGSREGLDLYRGRCLDRPAHLGDARRPKVAGRVVRGYRTEPRAVGVRGRHGR